MEEPILINRCRMDEEIYTRAFTRTLRPHAILLYCGAAVMVICGLVYAIASRFTDVLVPLMFLVLAGAEIYLARSTPTRTAKLNVNRLEDARGVKAFDTWVEFHDTEFLAGSEFADDPTEVPYARLQQIKVGDGVLLLWTQGRQFYVLDRQRFQMGKEEDFWRLMNEKAPNAVPKKYRSQGGN